MEAPDPRLLRLLEENGGWVSFEQYMRTALYDEGFGYYTAGIRNVGRTGDFSTAAAPDSLLGRALARWARRERQKLRGRMWHLIEIGGGNGDLAATILHRLGFLGRLGLTYHLVEISQPLQKLQEAKLRRFRVRWHTSTEGALGACNGVAVVFSNEWVDATPCRRFCRNLEGWQELGAALEAGKIRECTRAIKPGVGENLTSSAFDEGSGRSGQVVEVHGAFRCELEKIAANLIRGSLLTIDYGDHFPALYHRQPRGTARGYFHHQRVDGAEIYSRMGKQDLTADVNFTDLENWGALAGLKTTRFETQRDFILRHLGNIPAANTHEARLLDPVGAGTAFKVLHQSLGMA